MVSPYLGEFELLGDSQLLRFADKILGLGYLISKTTYTNSRHLGFCVSGQTITELENRLAYINYSVGRNVIVLIGTNDVIKKTNINVMCHEFFKIMSDLRNNCNKIVVLTIPPIAKYEVDPEHWATLKGFNTFLMNQGDGVQTLIVDTTTVFFNSSGIALEFFERTYTGGRPDLIHLNESGLLRLLHLLQPFL